MRTTIIQITLIALISPFVTFAQEQQRTPKATSVRKVPIEAFGTFAGTQESYAMYIGEYGLPVSGSDWKLKIKQNKVELFQYSSSVTYLYTGGYSVKKTGESDGSLVCKLKALYEGTVIDYTPTLHYRQDEEGQYYWILKSAVEGEPEVTLKRTE